MGGKKTEIVHFDIEDGRSIDLPVALVTGDSEGPDAVITAGIHGGEYGGIFAAIRLFRELSPSDIKGSVKFITVCDTAAFETRGSHLTADGANLNRCFPGRPGGGYAQSLAAKILDEIKGADYHIDLHSTSPLCISAPLSTYHRGRSGALNDGSHEIAYYYGIPNIVITETEGRWQDKGTCYASVYENIGIPSALVQTGTATASENVRRHIAGLMNVLRRFGTPALSPRPRRLRLNGARLQRALKNKIASGTSTAINSTMYYSIRPAALATGIQRNPAICHKAKKDKGGSILL